MFVQHVSILVKMCKCDMKCHFFGILLRSPTTLIHFKKICPIFCWEIKLEKVYYQKWQKTGPQWGKNIFITKRDRKVHLVPINWAMFRINHVFVAKGRVWLRASAVVHLSEGQGFNPSLQPPPRQSVLGQETEPHSAPDPASSESENVWIEKNSW